VVAKPNRPFLYSTIPQSQHPHTQVCLTVTTVSQRSVAAPVLHYTQLNKTPQTLPLPDRIRRAINWGYRALALPRRIEDYISVMPQCLSRFATPLPQRIRRDRVPLHSGNPTSIRSSPMLPVAVTSQQH
jgi:hypothetical protein